MANYFTRFSKMLLPLLLMLGIAGTTAITAQSVDVVSVYPTSVPTCITSVVTVPVVATGRMSTGVIPMVTVHFFNGSSPYVTSASVTGSMRDSFFVNIPAVYFSAGTYPIAVVATGGGGRDSMYVPGFITLRACPRITLNVFDDCNANCRKDSFEQFSNYTVNVRSSGGSINYNLTGSASSAVFTSPALDSTYTFTFTGLGTTTCSSPTTYTFRYTGDTALTIGASCSYGIDLVWANDTLPSRRGCDTTNLKYTLKIKSSTLSNVMTQVRIHHGDGTSATYPVYLNALGEANAIFNHDYTIGGSVNLAYSVTEPITGAYDSIYSASAYYVDTLCISISGFTFNDCDSNCIKGTSETPVPFATVNFNGILVTSDVNGFFRLDVPTGAYNISASKSGYIFGCNRSGFITAPIVFYLGAKCGGGPVTNVDITAANDTNRSYTPCDTNIAFFRVNGNSNNYPVGTNLNLRVYFGDGSVSNYTITTTASPFNTFSRTVDHRYTGSGNYSVSYVLSGPDGRNDSVFVPSEVVVPYCGGVNGYFYTDCDSDCVRDSSEIYSSWGYVAIQTLPTGPVYTATVSSGGMFSLAVAPGTYRLVPTASGRIVCPDSGTYIVTVPAAGFVSRNFGVECRIGIDLIAINVEADSGTYCAPHPARATVSGLVSGYPAGTRVLLEMFYDDGTHDTLSFTTTATPFTFSRLFRHTYRTSGVYNPGCVAIMPDGRRDTIQRFRYIVYDSCGSVRGTVYHDLNGDCILDSRDIRMSRVPVAVYIGGIYSRTVYTDASGNYSISIPAGVAVRISVPVSYTGLSTTCPVSGSYSFTSSSTPTSYTFGYGCRTGAYDLATRLSNISTLRAGSVVTVRFANNQYLRICTPVSGSVSLTVDSRLRYLSASPAPASISGSTYTWNFTTTTSIWSLLNSITFRADSALMPTDTLCFVLNITPTSGDINLINNTQRICLPVGRSYDPNMKETDLVGDGPEGYVEKDQTLTYTIHFQNTGNDTAMHVFVFDEIDSDLNMETLEILDASHVMNVYREGRMMKFDFPDIMLPDSGASYAKSQGYFTYRIAMNPGLPASTRIENFADIYFDWNDPIRTNTTLHTIRLANGIESVINGVEVSIFPNPATSYIDVQLDEEIEGTIQILDMRGAIVSTSTIQGKQSRTSVQGLAQGMYMVRVSTAAGVIATRRIIILS